MPDRVSVVRGFYQDDAKLMEGLDPDVEWVEMEGFPYGGTYRGKAALVAGVFERLRQDWESFAAVPDEVFAAGDDRVVSIGSYQGVSAQTGKPLLVAFAHVYDFHGARVVRFRQFADSALFRAAMV